MRGAHAERAAMRVPRAPHSRRSSARAVTCGRARLSVFAACSFSGAARPSTTCERAAACSARRLFEQRGFWPIWLASGVMSTMDYYRRNQWTSCGEGVRFDLVGTQGELPLQPLDKNGQRRGGKRARAGRPRAPHRHRSSERHKQRHAFRASHPLHVVTRVVPRVHSLRRRDLYAAIRDATITVAKHESARIVHLSIQRTHLHLVVEAAHKTALARACRAS